MGVASRDLTPLPGLDLSGFSPRTGASLGVRDAIELHLLVASNAGRLVMLAAYDLVGLTPDWIGATRERVIAATGIPPDQQMYACTHAHLGPETGAIPTMGQPDAGFLDALMDHTVSAASEATRDQRVVQLVDGHATSFVAINRRSRQFSPRAPADGDPDDIDPTVVTVQARDGSGHPVVTLVNYGCHPTSSRERVYSADYPGHLRRRVRQITGAPCVFINGAGGNANLRFDNSSQRGLGFARKSGGQVALTAIQALQEPRRGVSNRVGAAIRIAIFKLADLPSQAMAQELLAAGKANVAAAATDARRRHIHAFEVQHAERVLAAHDDPAWDRCLDVELQALRIGDLAVIATPVELFAADGLAMRSGSLAPVVMIAGWSNGNWGYLPTRRATAHGGYEVETAHRWYQQPTAWDPASGDTLRAAAREAIGELFSP